MQVASKSVTVYAIHGRTYEFQSSVDSGYVLDVQGGKTKNSAKMIVWQSNGGLNQKWKLNQK